MLYVESLGIEVSAHLATLARRLYVESVRGGGDFSPIECGYGEYVRFHGNSCEHFTELNLTGRSRVSIDFRVIRESEYAMRPVPGETATGCAARGSREYFRVGRYYKRCRLE